MRRSWMLVVIVMAGAVGARAQDMSAAEAAVKTQMRDKVLVLRSFDGASSQHYRVAGDHLVDDSLRFRMFTALRIDKVSHDGTVLRLAGGLAPVVRDADRKLTMAGPASPFILHVDLAGASPELLAQLPQELVYFDFTTAVSALPPSMRAALDNWSTKGAAGATPVAPCTCAQYLAGEKCTPRLGKDFGVTPPVVLQSVSPAYSEQAKLKKFSGDSRVYLILSTEGEPEDVFIAKPAGDGLDEKAAEAVAQYKFKPAMCGGTPVKVDLYIEVHFQIFDAARANVYAARSEKPVTLTGGWLGNWATRVRVPPMASTARRRVER